ncbi:hypothetical protein Tco_1165398 [Tanacetum coccineum]
MDEDELVPIILGRPFLATTRDIIDVHGGKLSLRVQSETATFNIRKSMKSKHSRDDYLYYADHTAKLVEEKWVDTINHDGKWTAEEEEDSNEVLAVSFYPRTEPGLEIGSIRRIQGLDTAYWGFLRARIRRIFLDGYGVLVFRIENNQLPVVISFALSTIEKAKLLEVLRNHKGAIAWGISDIKGIDSSFCTHKILMEDEFKPSVRPQRRVNPNIKEVVPKKGGMTIVKNEKDELNMQQTVTGWRIRDKKGAENLAAGHLFRLQNPDLGKLTKAEIRDLFPKERLMEIFDKNNESWYADYANYLASRVLPFRPTRQVKQKFFSDLRH